MLVSNCKYFSYLCSFFIKVRLWVCLHLFYFCAVATEDPFLSIIFLSTVLLLLCITEKLHCWIMIFSSYLMSEHGCPKKNPKDRLWFRTKWEEKSGQWRRTGYEKRPGSRDVKHHWVSLGPSGGSWMLASSCGRTAGRGSGEGWCLRCSEGTCHLRCLQFLSASAREPK